MKRARGGILVRRVLGTGDGAEVLRRKRQLSRLSGPVERALRYASASVVGRHTHIHRPPQITF